MIILIVLILLLIFGTGGGYYGYNRGYYGPAPFSGLVAILLILLVLYLVLIGAHVVALR